MSKSLGKTACGQYLLKSSFQDPLPYAIDKQVKNAIPVMMNAINNLSCGILRGVQTPPATFQAHLALCQLNQGVLSLSTGVKTAPVIDPTTRPSGMCERRY